MYGRPRRVAWTRAFVYSSIGSSLETGTRTRVKVGRKSSLHSNGKPCVLAWSLFHPVEKHFSAFAQTSALIWGMPWRKKTLKREHVGNIVTHMFYSCYFSILPTTDLAWLNVFKNTYTANKHLLMQRTKNKVSLCNECRRKAIGHFLMYIFIST